MLEQTGDSYTSAKYAKAMFASDSKIGKTCFLIASALGVLPWQKQGGVVTSPKHLHVLAMDAGAVNGVKRFLLETCGAPPEATQFHVLNFQDDCRRVSQSNDAYDFTFFNTLRAAIQDLNEQVKRVKGVHAVLFSSLTGGANAMERGIIGPPGGESGENKGYSDPSKWKQLAHQLNEIRNDLQVDDWHCFWECHIDKPAKFLENEAPKKETIRVSGEAGRNWAFNVEQVFRIRRQFGQRYEKTNCDLVHLDTKAVMDFCAQGRGANEALKEKEYDLTAAFSRLGLQVGHWGQKTKAAAK